MTTCEECGGNMDGQRADAKVCSPRCRAARSRRLRGVHYVAEPYSAPRSGPNARSGLQVSYAKAVLAAEELAYSMVWAEERPYVQEIKAAAEEAMRGVLSDRQRATLEARNGGR